MIDCEWLPPLVPYAGDDWKIYENTLYEIFKEDFIASPPSYENNKVAIRKHPMFQEKEEAFFHITCQDYQKEGERVPDLRRCERIRWAKTFIENTKCNKGCFNCGGLKIWDKPHNSTVRTHILFEEQRYIVVLEKRIEYTLLITAFYLHYDHALTKKLKEYEKYK